MKVDKKLAVLVTVFLLVLFGVLLFFGFFVNSEFEVLDSEARVSAFNLGLFGYDCEDGGVNHRYFSSVVDPEVPDEFGFFGVRGTRLLGGVVKIVGYYEVVECDWVDEFDEFGNPLGGHGVYSYWVDPNNGWISRRICNPDHVSDCPENIERRANSENPDYEVYLGLI